MLNVSKWAVLVLSMFSLAIVGCGDDDKKENDDGAAGSDGKVEEKTTCEAMCDNVYACGFAYGELDRDACVTACEDETLAMDPVPCMADTTDCQEIIECTYTCHDWAYMECTSEGGVCESEELAADACADANGCRTEAGLDPFCFWIMCEAEGEALFDCLDTKCEPYMACPDEE